MRDIERINEQRDLRLEREIDERIASVQRLLGEDPKRRCKHCEKLSYAVGHADDCTLRRIDPDLIRRSQSDAAIELRKNVNKQRIFKSDRKVWNGLPHTGVKTLVRKRTSKNRGPVTELERCTVCAEQTLKIATGDGMVCRECGHVKACEFVPNGINCRLCFPNSKPPVVQKGKRKKKKKKKTK